MNLPLIIHEDGTIYFYKKLATDELYISNYLKKTTKQEHYENEIEIYKLEDFSIISLILYGEKRLEEFIKFLNDYNYNQIPEKLVKKINIIEENIKLVSLELSKTEVIIKVLKGDISFLTEDSQLRDKLKFNKAKELYTYPKKDNFQLIDKLAEKDINMVFPTCDAGKEIQLNLKKELHLRYYQEQAFEALVNKNVGLAIMPVSSGKTYVAMNLINRFKNRTLILCENKDNCFRWKKDLTMYFDIEEDDVLVCIENKNNYQIKKINIFSYDVIRKRGNELIFEELNKNNWGIVIYDNAHKVVTKKSIDLLYLKSKYKFAFDATINRRDGRQRSLYNLFGGVTYNISSNELINKLFQKKLKCFKVDLRKLSFDEEKFIETIIKKNPNKGIVIVAHNAKDIDKICRYLNILSINKDTENITRLDIIKKFNNNNIKVIAISNLIANYDLTNIDIMIAMGYRGKNSIEDIFRLGALVGTTKQLERNIVVYKYYLIRDDKEHSTVLSKEELLEDYGIIFNKFDINEFMGCEC